MLASCKGLRHLRYTNIGKCVIIWVDLKDFTCEDEIFWTRLVHGYLKASSTCSTFTVQSPLLFRSRPYVLQFQFRIELTNPHTGDINIPKSSISNKTLTSTLLTYTLTLHSFNPMLRTSKKDLKNRKVYVN